MGDDECDLTRGGHSELERTSCDERSREPCNYFSLYALQRFSSFGNPSRSFRKSRFTLLGFAGQGTTCETYGSGHSPLVQYLSNSLHRSSPRLQWTCHLRQVRGKLAGLGLEDNCTPPTVCDCSRHKDWLVGVMERDNHHQYYFVKKNRTCWKGMDRLSPLTENGYISGNQEGWLWIF